MAVIVVGILSFSVGVVAAYLSTVTYLFLAAVTLTFAAVVIGIAREASVAMILLAWATGAVAMQLGFVVSIGVQALQRQRTRLPQGETKSQDQQIPVRSPDTFEL
jgi:CHASE2 domain-containing sensor protein